MALPLSRHQMVCAPQPARDRSLDLISSSPDRHKSVFLGPPFKIGKHGNVLSAEAFPDGGSYLFGLSRLKEAVYLGFWHEEQFADSDGSDLSPADRVVRRIPTKSKNPGALRRGVGLFFHRVTVCSIRASMH